MQQQNEPLDADIQSGEAVDPALQFDHNTRETLGSTSFWAYGQAILFGLFALAILAGVIFGFQEHDFINPIALVFFVIFSVVFAFFAISWGQFGQYLQLGFEREESDRLENAFSALQRLYIGYGVMIILLLVTGFFLGIYLFVGSMGFSHTPEF